MGYYIYKHLNSDMEVIYVGLTTDILTRQSAHKSTSHWKDEIYKVEYTEVSDDMLMEIYEKYYIDKYLPKYNTKDIDCKYSRFFKNMEELEFKEYIGFRLKKHKKEIEIIPFYVYFEQYYRQSVETIERFKEEYTNNGRLKKGDRAYLDNNFECIFSFSSCKGFEGVNMLQGGEFHNKFGYNINRQGINMDKYNHLKSEEQLKYKSLDDLWEEIFK